MKTTPYISLILPAYNEAKRIQGTIDEVATYFQARQWTYEIIVSADGDDGTREIVREMAQQQPNLQVIGSPGRHGKGHGLRQAMPLASGKFVGFSDADNKTPISEFDKVQSLLEAGWDVVIGSRGMADSQIEQKQPLLRQLGSRGFAVFMHTVVGLHDIVDTQCGFKFFKRSVAQTLFERQIIDGYMYDVEILALAKRLHYTIQQVPIRWRDDGDSRLNLVAGNLRNAWDIFRIRWNMRQQQRVASAALDDSVSSI
ncbi:glycosyltransferase family 2 protein [bacterium]|nr:glycosyltransferase family 2 protein [bacterium]